MKDDPGERHNIIGEHPDVAARIDQLANKIREELGDSLTGSSGQGIRSRATIFDISDERLLIDRAPKPVKEDLITHN